MELHFRGVEGTLPDALASIKYYDELMARNLLLMVVQLGQTTHGARALGETFADFFALGLEAMATWVQEVVQNYFIEDWYDWNFGETSDVPLLKFDVIEDPQLPATDLVAMANAGLVTIDEELKAWLRERYRMPAPDPATAEAPQLPAVPPGTDPALPQGTPGGQPSGQPAVTAGRAVRLQVSHRKIGGQVYAAATQEFRRNMYEHEIQAAFDPIALDQSYQHRLADIMTAYTQGVRPAQIDALVAAVEKAATPEQLAALAAPVLGAAEIEKVLKEAAQDGMDMALNEAFSQLGQQREERGDYGSRLIQQRSEAMATLFANSLSQSAATKALQMSHDGKGGSVVAARVREHLSTLKESWLHDHMGGAVNAAQNQGRDAVFGLNRPSAIYASELLDVNTCAPCRSVDGKQYASVADADADYPTGGYHACSGGPRCRGTKVAVWDV
jgi:hypothetical protein